MFYERISCKLGGSRMRIGGVSAFGFRNCPDVLIVSYPQNYR